MDHIDLGFVKPITPSKSLISKYFPSKIGGKVAWLSYKDLPTCDYLKCQSCHQQLSFLMQIYAPIQSNLHAFHRTLFIFCCRHDCPHRTFKVLRSQLKRDNQFYSFQPPNYDEPSEGRDHDYGVKLCHLCGIFANKSCSKCKSVSYCSRDHQVIDWKEGKHKEKCGKEIEERKTLEKIAEETKRRKEASSVVFPEYELEIGNEDDYDDDGDESNDDSSDGEREEKEEKVNKRMKEFEELMRKNKPEYQNESLEGEYEEENEDERKERKVYDKFVKESEKARDQVVRYIVHGMQCEPLWMSEKGKPTSPIPNCEYCGGERKFELQIMPQLLHYISSGDDGDVDWGVIAIYTCYNSCSSGDKEYKEEFAWCQNVS